MTAVLVVLLVLALVVPLGIWAARAVRRQTLLYRMQECAATYWEYAAAFPALERKDRRYSAQAEHLDRHIRLAREERGSA